MKRDGRKLDHTTLEEFWFLALRRVKEGEKPSEVVKSLGMNRTSIYRGLKAAAGRGKGERALLSRPATGRPPKLTPTQQAQVFRWINGKDPRQYGLDFGLWTRQIAATLIEQKFGVHLGVTAVGRLLARLGLTPQSHCSAPTSAILKPSSAGSAKPTPASQLLRGKAGPTCTSGTSRDSGPTPCTARPGRPRARPRSSSAPGNASRFRRPRQSTPRVGSGLQPTRAR